MSATPRILFVDDEELVLKAIFRDFLDEDYEIITATSGREGLELLEQFPVEVVISDFRMPQMDGGEFLKRVSERWPDTVRIVLSGYADISSVIAAINQGAIFKFVTKPWQRDELQAAVSEALTKYHEMSNMRALAEQALGAVHELFDDERVTRSEVHQRNLQLEEAHRDMEVYRVMFHSLDVPLILFDVDGLLSVANPAAIHLLTVAAGTDGRAMVPDALLDDVAGMIAGDSVTPKPYQIAPGTPQFEAAITLLAAGSSSLGVVAVLTAGK